MIAALHLFTQIVKERTAPDVGSPGFAPGNGVVGSLRRLCSAYITISWGDSQAPSSPSQLNRATELDQGGEVEEAPARKSLLDGHLLVTLVVAKSVVFQMFHCPEETFPNLCGSQK